MAIVTIVVGLMGYMRLIVFRQKNKRSKMRANSGSSNYSGYSGVSE